ncbi:hypothetical protein HHI36_023384 [Cryptolaemus montrouzieri]|uniref:Uncharacterized protein n=1 Tax=Cryptolaemus montrouzieri TaxID=559131 RepID=A0ABD2PGE4_9CUCU
MIGSNSGKETTPLDATMMNQYFATIGSALDDDVDRSEDAVGGIRIMSTFSMFLHATTSEEVMNVVAGMKNKSTCDIYGLNKTVIVDVVIVNDDLDLLKFDCQERVILSLMGLM